ncbi:putative redoxin [Pseudonocardia sp. Ae406_Ps2]|uniref:glutaredoxin family protein n=1 Tax=unclassified Pseudonocardia TaxID=2619320 RepID=UPI0006CB326A|nr:MULTISPECIES: glutaredoxin family protein [unclassified Pseudonocardia]ALE81777.1 glutaredoxin [Pseudonocardia sp. HH130629-09]OLL97809.1 putative redoxin [Pseudonocardia sp. Ae331_Ps2]OLM04479.1 putative redoxin [Pseudonocardia sp. Ae406_Ps2]OLM10688.1 putative redoxin [Pseudonocardia sp. Ae505_Ps2]OLM26041.1 putative redoxin [Pseudonocardia sp. Ae706_Ps2]
MRVRLLTRVGCHLCDDAAEVLARVCAETDTGWDTVDVDSDDELRAEYGDQVPVVLLDGREHDSFRVDEERLRADLARR